MRMQPRLVAQRSFKQSTAATGARRKCTNPQHVGLPGRASRDWAGTREASSQWEIRGRGQLLARAYPGSMDHGGPGRAGPGRGAGCGKRGGPAPSPGPAAAASAAAAAGTGGRSEGVRYGPEGENLGSGRWGGGFSQRCWGSGEGRSRDAWKADGGRARDRRAQALRPGPRPGCQGGAAAGARRAEG